MNKLQQLLQLYYKLTGFLHHEVEKIKPIFTEESSPYRMFYPLFEAMETFFFQGNERVTVAPHVRDAIGLKRYMSMVIVALMPAYLFGLAIYGPRVLLMTAVSYTAGGIVEAVFAIVRKEEINEGFLVTGLIFPMILPPGTSLWMVAFGVAFGVFFGKEIFGGTGHNIFNPALAGRCFLMLSWPRQLGEGHVLPFGWVNSLLDFDLWAVVITPAADIVTSATPLWQVSNAIKETGTFEVLSAATLKMYLGFTAGSIAETCFPLIVIPGAFLCWTKVANWRIPVVTLLTFVVVGGILSHPAVMPEAFVNPLIGLAQGGLVFAVFFMATDPVSSPATNRGKIIYAVGIGILVVLVRGIGAVPEGVTYAILIMNIFSSLIDRQIIRMSVPAPLPRRERENE
ncbi:MAG: RnfABCDGE type electron transport complex subunit D [Planctomycetota bacterium]|jgi:RnfABCDGE-type electron transport complex D subunit